MRPDLLPDLAADPRQDFWAITTYFNLTDSVRRRQNYHGFRRQLSVPLLTVEWNPDGQFQLGEGDADSLLQIAGGDLMWQKERLLSMAVAALPDHVKYVAWIDCDVLFADPDWADEAKELLADKSVIQLFSEVGFPDIEMSAELIRAPALSLDSRAFDLIPTRQSFLRAFRGLEQGIVGYDLDLRFEQAEAIASNNIMQRPAHGFAWAAQSSFLRKVGLYDRCIVGTGDMLFCYGITGLAQSLIDSQREAGWAFYGDCPSYRRWATRAAEVCSTRLGCLDGRIVHLFHGEMRERQYKSRIDGLVPFALDLDQDISAPDGGPWVWKRDRSALNAYFLKYMRGRNEDGRLASAGEMSGA
jgi:hypothetical protein